MNERIQQLAEQAGFVDKGSNHTAYMSFDHEKFADIIVRECAQVADIERDTSAGCGYVTQTTGQRIKKHFGVEE